MKLIFIYGPPAAGKLTVAKELVKLTNFKNFHNHYAHDFVSVLIDYTNKNFFRHIQKVMFDGIEIAAKERVPGVIFTFCYDHKHDATFTRKIINVVKENKGSIKFVQLTCSDSELFKRVKEKSRKRYGKVRTVKALKNLLKKWALDQKIPFVKSLVVDNTSLSAKKVALKIKKEFKL